jgi:hypothetical protein
LPGIYPQRTIKNRQQDQAAGDLKLNQQDRWGQLLANGKFCMAKHAEVRPLPGMSGATSDT